MLTYQLAVVDVWREACQLIALGCQLSLGSLCRAQAQAQLGDKPGHRLREQPQGKAINLVTSPPPAGAPRTSSSTYFHTIHHGCRGQAACETVILALAPQLIHPAARKPAPLHKVLSLKLAIHIFKDLEGHTQGRG